MNIQESFARWLIAILTTSIILTGIGKLKMEVEASELVPSVSTSKIYDIALTKTGIVANQSTIESMINQIINVIEGTAQSYDQWCTDNGKVKNGTTWEEYLESDAYASLPYRLSGWALRSADIIAYIIDGESLTDELRDMLPTAITGLPAGDIAKGFTLPDEVVKELRNDFDGYIKDYGDYFYVQTIGPEQLNPLWFSKYSQYETVKQLLESLPHLGYFYCMNGYPSTGTFSMGTDNDVTASDGRFGCYEEEVYFVAEKQEGYLYYIKNTYDSKWQTPTIVHESGGGFDSFKNSYEAFLNDNTFTSHYAQELNPRMTELGYVDNKVLHYGLCSNDGRLVKIFNSEMAMRQFTLNSQNYYYTNKSMDYSKTTDNSVSVTGDYLVDNSTVYSHDIIQETINNTENVTEETINNIVNDSSQTIINNYGSTNSSGGSGGSDDSGSGSFGDGLLGLLKGLGELLDFILGLFGEVISIIAGFLQSLLDIVKSLGGIFTGFSGLLGEIFTFIPSELIELISVSIQAVIIIAVWKLFKK